MRFFRVLLLRLAKKVTRSLFLSLDLTEKRMGRERERVEIVGLARKFFFPKQQQQQHSQTHSFQLTAGRSRRTRIRVRKK